MIDIVIKNYFPNATSYNVKPFGNGHINDTYKVEFENPSSTYLLQRINTSVFKNPEIIIENHLRLQNEFSKNNHSLAIAQLMPDNNGKYLYIDNSGGAWRLTTFFKVWPHFGHFPGSPSAILSGTHL